MDATSSCAAPNATFRLGLQLTPARLTVALTLAALGLRLLHLGSRPLWLDEAFSAWFSDQSFHYLWHVLPTYEPHPPLYYSLLRLWRLLVGPNYLAMRSLSVVLGALTVPIVTAIIAEQERQRPTGRPLLRVFVGGFLAACSPMLIVVGQEARPYPLLTMAYSLSILCLLIIIRQFREGGPGTWFSWTLLAASAVVTSWSHALGIFYVAAIAGSLFPHWVSAPLCRKRIGRGTVAASFFLVMYLPCLVMMSGRAHDWSANWLQWEPALFVPQLLSLYTVPVEALSIASAIAAIAMALLLKRGVASTWRSAGWNCERLMLLLWLGPPLLAGLISAIFEPVFLARTLTGTLVPAYLMIAGAIAREKDQRELRLIVAGLSITLLPAAVSMSTRPAGERWDLLSSYLSRNVRPSDQIWLYPADSALPLGAVGSEMPAVIRPIPEPFPTLHFNGPIRAGWHGVVSVTRAQAQTFANDPTLRAVPAIWLVTRQSRIFDPANDLPNALAEVRRAGPVQQWGYIVVRPYYRR